MGFEKINNFNKAYCEVLRYSQGVSKALFLFHGYPADGGEKNRDIARQVSASCHIDTYIIHYPGLGNSSGNFNFSDSIDVSKEFFTKYSGEYKEVYLFGHSWGGLVALNIFSQFKQLIKGIILAAPFSIIPQSENDLHQIVKSVYTETRHLLQEYSFEDVLGQIKKISSSYNPEEIIKFIESEKIQVHLIHARQDEEIPIETSQKFLSYFKNQTYVFKQVEDDHSFSRQREQLINFVSGALCGD